MTPRSRKQPIDTLVEYAHYGWALAFARPGLHRMHKLMLSLSLRGLGVSNHRTPYVAGERDWLRSYLAPLRRPVVIDGGAHTGAYTTAVLATSPEAVVHAFEPNATTFGMLVERLAGRCICVNKALGSSSRPMLLYDYAGETGTEHASVFKGVLEELHGGRAAALPVEATTLDRYCADAGIYRVDLLKLDLEGNEHDALVGAQALLEEGAIRAIQFEFNEMNLVSRTTFRDFVELLKGFDLYRLLPGGRLLSLRHYASIYCEVYAYQNVVALRRS